MNIVGKLIIICFYVFVATITPAVVLGITHSLVAAAAGFILMSGLILFHLCKTL